MGLIRRAKAAISALSRLFGYATKQRVRRHASQHRNAEFNLTVSQVQKIMRAATSPRDRLIIRLFAETGIRRSELADLHWEDIDFAGLLVVIRNGKGHKMRVIPLTRDTAQMLLFLAPRTVQQGPVFLSRQSVGLSLRQINRIVSRAGAAAGVRHPNPRYRDITPHLFRHTFARHWKAHGGSLESLASILGHTDMATTAAVYGRESLHDVQRNYATTLERMFNPRRTRSGTQHIPPFSDALET